MAMRGLCVLLTAVMAVGGDRHKQELKEHYDHLAFIADFNCQRPQPRVMSVPKVFPPEETVDRAFFPDVTVLHRCEDNVGCCPSDHLCRPKEIVSLDLPFKVTFLENMGKHKKGSWIIKYYKFDNHTECTCEEPPHVQEPLECVQLRESCEALTVSCSRLQDSCPRLAWTPQAQTTTTTTTTTSTTHPTTPEEETTINSEGVV